MGFWNIGNKENQSLEENENFTSDQSTKLIEAFEERRAASEKFSGLFVYVEGKDFKKDKQYKLSINDSEFHFSFYLDKNYYYREEDYQSLLDIKDIILEKDKYICEVQKPKVEVSENKSSDFLGEKDYVIKEVELNLINKQDVQEIISIRIVNSKQDEYLLHSLYREYKIKNFYNWLHIPKDNFVVSVIKPEDFFNNMSYQIYRDNGVIIFIRNKQNIYRKSNEIGVCMVQIKVKDIRYYKTEGLLRYEQSLSGGGGMGVNYGGAVLGGLLFGEVGASIGSRKNQEIKSITSETVEHDTRIINLVFEFEEKEYSVGFDITNEMVFDWLIPEKQYEYVIKKRREYYESEL